MSDHRIYLDSQAGQPPNSAILEMAKAMMSLAWNDGKSRNYEAAVAQSAMELALQTVANRLEVNPSQVIAVHRLGNVFDLLADRYPNTAKSAVSRQGALQSFGGQLLPVDGNGRITTFLGFDSFFAPAANQETGVIENIESIIEQSGAVAIIDATEWIGRRKELPAGDLLIARASAFGGPNSVCFIISRTEKLEVEPRRLASLQPGNFDLLWASAALEQLEDINLTEVKTQTFANEIRKKLAEHEPIAIHGDGNTLPHLISFAIENVDSETAAVVFDKHGIAVGSGSACAFSYSQSSHVLQAMGVQGAGNVRLSIPLNFTETDLEIFLAKIPAVLNELAQTL